MPALLTFGHGTAGREELTTLLRDVAAAQVVDVRRYPGSRRNPEVASEQMAQWLPPVGIGYRWDARLGGRRRLPAGTDDTDPWWRVEAFRAYAAHMRTAEFADAMAELLEELDSGRALIMCSESLWWRCHRRMISDAAMLLQGVEVSHLGHDGRLTPHVPAAGARVADGVLVYDGREDS